MTIHNSLYSPYALSIEQFYSSDLSESANESSENLTQEQDNSDDRLSLRVCSERALRRFQLFRSLGEDHDGEGAKQPSPAALKTAETFVAKLPFYAPPFVVGVDNEGGVVVDFFDGPDLWQVRIDEDRNVSLVHRSEGEVQALEGSIDDKGTRDRFQRVCGFQLLA